MWTFANTTLTNRRTQRVRAATGGGDIPRGGNRRSPRVCFRVKAEAVLSKKPGACGVPSGAYSFHPASLWTLPTLRLGPCREARHPEPASHAQPRAVCADLFPHASHRGVGLKVEERVGSPKESRYAGFLNH